MKNFPLLLFLALFFAVGASAQTNQNPACPTIDVSAINASGGGVMRPGEPRTYTANVQGIDLKRISYRWTVSNGTIVSGQGTPVIEVDTTGLDGENITATVEIKGLADGCPNTKSETGAVCSCLHPLLIEEYGKISFTKEKVKLDYVADELAKNEAASVYFIIYSTDREKPDVLEARQANIEKYLMEKHKIPRNRIVFVLADSDAYLTKIFIVPEGADAPLP
jgi:hypothetical protein